MRRILLIIILAGTIKIYGQQNHTLYFLNNVPQTNMLNPAVQTECKVFIGLPVISSLHINLANSGFTMNQLLDSQDSSEYSIDAATIHDKLGKRNYLSSELYADLLNVGIKIKKRYYFTFAIRERNDLNLFYTKNLFSLAYKGNTQYEGEWVSLKGNGLQFNHFREFSLGISKIIDEYTTWGIRAKLLFGKLNLKTSRENVSLFTEENTFDLFFKGDFRADASLPVSLDSADGNLRPDYEYYSTDPVGLIFNRQNTGIAVDAGFIHHYDEKITLHGSLLDLGLIPYRSDLTNYSVNGEYVYTGPLGDTIITEDYIEEVFDRINDSMDVSLTRESYIYVLSPRLYLGISYQLNRNTSVNALLAARFWKQKIQTGLTITGTWRPYYWFAATASWSYFHRSINNIGAGIVLGRNPVQFYLVSDNVPGFIWPQSTKNLNLRFGFNMIFGCREKHSIKECGCYWLREAEKRNERKQKLIRK
ncbi:MAG: hypothetical protein JW723_01125 [Bacteroidales bacterium]|nr:hypothetical protein [Bacteroidales bacterium]